MKKNVSVCTAIIIAFFIGFGLGILTWVNRDATAVISSKCFDGSRPDKHGCCPGEVYTDMGDLGFNCCPGDSEDSDCFPPLK